MLGLLCFTALASSTIASASLDPEIRNIRRRANNDAIPRTIWFTYPHDILETREPKALYFNVLNLIDTYRDAWEDPNAEVKILNDDQCAEELAMVEPELVTHFKQEEEGSIKDDMCRVALLYNHGGYYFDVDVEMFKAYHPSEGTAVAATTSCDGECIYQAFLASVPRHPLLKKTLTNMLDVYRYNLEKEAMGAYTMAQAYYGMEESEKSEVDLLEEFLLDVPEEGETAERYPSVERQEGSGKCNYVIHDPEIEEIYFFSRIVGSKDCTSSREIYEPGITHNEAAKKKSFDIPFNLIFASKENILRTREPYDLYANIMNIIEKYGEASNGDAIVYFLDERKCIETIKRALPALVKHYEAEENDTHKQNMCKMAALYTHGGYYMDMDLEVVEPFIPRGSVSFVGAKGCGGGCFYPSFMMSMPKHPIAEKTLQEMLNIYENGEDTLMMGPISMSKAYHDLTKDKKSDMANEVRLLEELQLDMGLNLEHYPELTRQQGTGQCNFVIHDPKWKVVHFFAHFLGRGGCNPSADPFTN